MANTKITEPSHQMSPTERKAATSLALLYALRMLGLFMVLPVMMIEGSKLEGASASLLGLALGIYGLSQALLQIPAGTLSDRIGRKPVIIGGLIIFAFGSMIAALATSIEMMILGRALQGAGAIASAIMALLTDLTREEHRMKAMATVGVSIGLSFSVALILGPWLASLGGLPLIFGLTALLALAGALFVWFFIPTPPKQMSRDTTAVWTDLGTQLRNGKLWPLNTGIFLIHALMVAVFIVIPKKLEPLLAPYDLSASWVYLPILLLAFLLMVPFIIVAEKRRKLKSVVMTGVIGIAISLIIMLNAHTLWHWILAMLLYFWGFNLMEASLPSWLSKVAPAGAKGSAMGLYSTLQFLGAFLGGALGGRLFEHYGSDAIFLIFTALVLLWTLYLLLSPAPKHVTSLQLHALNGCTSEQLHALQQLAGVDEVALTEGDVLYFKIDATSFDQQQALAIIQP